MIAAMTFYYGIKRQTSHFRFIVDWVRIINGSLIKTLDSTLSPRAKI